MTKNQQLSPKRDSTRLYTCKAQVYARSRPDYLPKAFAIFQEMVKLPGHSVVVDVGAGTGMLTRHLLALYDTVYALEPSLEMRQIAEKELGDQPGFHSLDSRAEDIPLADHSVDLIAVGQAIHWFQPEAARREFQRIAKLGAWLLLAHIKSLDEELNHALGAIFTEEYGCLPQDEHPASNLVPDSYYFAGKHSESLQFPHNHQESWESFLGGIGTAAYAPDPDHPRYPNFFAAARKIFDRFSREGVLTWKIATVTSFGLLA